jgi:hypothetical protein
MPCYRCGVRQSDPGKGPSPWKRGVICDEAVLVCPRCQTDHDWTADLDRCPECGSTMLVRVLGETRCRECGWTRQGGGTSAPVTDHALADDVAAALRKRFGA